jgi:hypothetical protein
MGLTMKTRDLDTLCAIAARLLQDVATLRELGCEKIARLLEAAESELDTYVYAGGCQESGPGEVESTTQH